MLFTALLPKRSNLYRINEAYADFFNSFSFLRNLHKTVIPLQEDKMEAFGSPCLCTFLIQKTCISSSLQVTEKIAFKNESFPQPGPEEMKPGGALHDAHRVPGMPARRQKLQDGIICIGIHYFRILQNLYLANLLFNSSRTGFTSDCLLSTHFFQFASKSPLWRIRLAYSF